MDRKQSADQKGKKKSPWRFLFLALAVYGALKLAGGLGINLLYLFFKLQPAFDTGTAVSIGIIGGADGPTAIFLSGSVWISYLIPAVMLIVGVVGYGYCCRKPRG